MSNKEMTTVVLNALLEEWGNFNSTIHGGVELIHSRIYGHYARLKKPN